MRRVRSLCIAVVIVVVVLWVLTPMARAMLLLHDTQHVVGSAPKIAGVQARNAHFYTTSDYNGQSYSSIDDNPIPIDGWFVLKRATAPTVILLPGWKDDRTSMLKYATFLVHGGLNVLMIDFRGTGHSGGSFSLGLFEPTDVKAAVTYLDTIGGLSNHHYGVLGVSFGAGVALATAGGNGAEYPGDSEINAIVADSPWATEQPTVNDLNALDLFGHSIPLSHSIDIGGHHIDFLPDAGWAVDHTIGGSSTTRSALAGAEHLQSTQALLIIHSVHDVNSTTSASAAYALYNAAPVRHKQLWMAPLGGHAGAYDAQPAVYQAKVLGFFAAYLVSIKDAPAAPPAALPRYPGGNTYSPAPLAPPILTLHASALHDVPPHPR